MSIWKITNDTIDKKMPINVVARRWDYDQL